MKNVCIIGFGRAGKLQLHAISDICNVVAVIDVRASVESNMNETISFSQNLRRAFDEEDVDAVVVTTPTKTHFEICKEALLHKKHVFVEKPLANDIHEYRELYKLADLHNRLLYIGFNRRHDPEWLKLVEKLRGRIPLHVSIVCRDHPFPPASYLQECGGIFKDCVVHDIDMICFILSSYPDTVECSIDDAGETASTHMVFHINGAVCQVKMIHSRHSPRYEQFVSMHCADGCIEMGRDRPPDGTSFDKRYEDSYKMQLRDFAHRLESPSPTHNISLSHSLQMERILEACDESAKNQSVQHIKSIRAYQAAETNVRQLYKTARMFHTPEVVTRLKETYRPGKQNVSMSIWEVLHELKCFRDVSDPDVDVPNDQHALQTAESIRRQGLPDWLQLVGLIHDFGKVIYKWGTDEDGTSIDFQHSIVGDTFIVGCTYPDCLVYPEFNALVENRYDELGIYTENCGLDNCMVSYGHDEYLYQVLLHSNTNLPDYALKIIRYHSLYAWHDKGAYARLENREDTLVKGWIKLFNSHDLYSKRNRTVDLRQVKSHYTEIASRYLPNGLKFLFTYTRSGTI